MKHYNLILIDACGHVDGHVSNGGKRILCEIGVQQGTRGGYITLLGSWVPYNFQCSEFQLDHCF